jgi:hypothetical protein
MGSGRLSPKLLFRMYRYNSIEIIHTMMISYVVRESFKNRPYTEIRRLKKEALIVSIMAKWLDGDDDDDIFALHGSFFKSLANKVFEFPSLTGTEKNFSILHGMANVPSCHLT